MTTSGNRNFHNAGGQKILLVGDVSKVFLDTDDIDSNRYEVCTDVPDAIDAVGRSDFAAIGIVMSQTSAEWRTGLKALRDNCDSRIILLAQMYEEPMAIQLVSSATNGESWADDYFICPVSADKFYESIITSWSGREGEAILPVTVDATIENRMRLLEKLATEDDLTGLKNRRYIWEFSRQIIERARKTNGRVTLLIFDIDNFKQYNDVYGHCAGDEILRQAAILIRRCCRSHDVVGRIGGDEFAVVFWDRVRSKLADQQSDRRLAAAEHPKEAVFIAKRFRREFEKAELHLLGPEGKGVLTISGGLASYPRDGSTIQELFQQADKALLEAKRSGKNRIYLVGKPQGDIADIE